MGEEVRHEPPSPESLAAGYEVTDAHLRPIVISVIVLIVVAVVVHVALWGLMKGLEAGESGRDVPLTGVTDAQRPRVPEPRLQPLIGQHDTTPAQDLRAMNEQNARRLNSAGWVDRERGVAHIPIDRAMQLLVERGQSGAAPTTQGANQ